MQEEHGGPRTLTLLSRAYCHLCDEMRDALLPVIARHRATLVEVDIDVHPALESAHGERVPVLFLGGAVDGIELCHYRLDAAAVNAALAKQLPSTAFGSRPE